VLALNSDSNYTFACYFTRMYLFYIFKIGDWKWRQYVKGALSHIKVLHKQSRKQVHSMYKTENTNAFNSFSSFEAYCHSNLNIL